MSFTTRVLLLEDNPGDARLVEIMLGELETEEATYELDWARSLSEGLGKLSERGPDVVLVDLSLPDSAGLDTLTRVQEVAGRIPVVPVTGQGCESLAVDAMKSGAADYVSKNGLNARILGGAIEAAIERASYARKLDELEALKSDIVATTSHELRTPLAIIREYVSLVNDGVAGPTTEQQRECLGSALRNCDRLASLINDTLDLHRLETGTTRVWRGKTQLRDLIDECVSDFAPQAEKCGIDIEVEVADSLPPVLADRGQIAQVLVNLMGNALKFTEPGGRVLVGGRADESSVWVDVTDTGVGIPPTELKRVFERFHKLGHETAPGVQGTGLGLAIVRKILQAHDGEVLAESEPGRGSTFTFRVPHYSERGELRAVVWDNANRAHDRSKGLGLTVVRVNQEEAWSSRLASELHELVRQTLRRSNDAVLKLEDERIVLAMGEVDSNGAATMRRRIERSVLTHFGRSLPAKFASATVFPGEDPEVVWDGLEFSTGRLAALRVLVIDDDPTFLEITSRWLRSAEFPTDVSVAQDAYEGMLQLGEVAPELVVLDVCMPDLEIGRLLTQIERAHRPTAVLVVSSSREELARIDSATARMEKPLDREEFLETVLQLGGYPGQPDPTLN